MNNPPQICGRYFVMKRIFDIFSSTIILITVLPILLLVALLIKLESPGPVLFWHERLGRHGKPFKYLKFRTMKLHSEQVATGPIFQLRSDPRISRIGRFLRMTAIDELPAVINVLRGDMSIVGPRAALPLEAARYSETQKRRLELRPGITGYWQVFGREAGATDMDQMIKMDIEYAEKQSLLFDLRILLRTVRLVLTSKAAY
jgi:lipopolysaccharide/colanic/teichoic acid biosynthesis glycosyltransferase